MILTGAFRVAAASTGARAAMLSRAAVPAAMQARCYSAHSETFEEFNARYVQFFEGVQDLFELQRGLNNAFGQDLVPSPEVIEKALHAARRVNDYATAVRIFEGIKQKVDSPKQYEQYVQYLEPVRNELGVDLREQLYNN